MKVLVTGANGHIGSHVVRACENLGYEVRAFVREGADCRGLESCKAERFIGDIYDKQSLRMAASDCDVIIHMATVFKLYADDPQDIIRPAVEGAKNIIEVASELGINRIVYTSSMATVGAAERPDAIRDNTQWSDPPESSYAIAKLESERVAQNMAKENGIDIVTICPCAVLGSHDYRITPTSQMVVDIATGKTPVLLGGFNVVAVEDVAKVHALAVEQGEPGKRYIVGSDNLTLLEMGKIIQKYGGKKPVYLPIPRALVMTIVHVSKRVCWLLRKPVPEDLKMAEDAFGKYSFYDVRETLDTFDYRPISSEQAIKNSIDWLISSNKLAI